MSKDEVNKINFDGKLYSIESLTENVKGNFNLLLKVQQDIAIVVADLKIKQAAQVQLALRLKELIIEDKIEGLKVDGLLQDNNV